MSEQLDYLKGLLGAKATEAIVKEFTNTSIPEAQFTDRKGYEAALAAVTKELDALRKKPYFSCPSAVSRYATASGDNVTLETMMWDWKGNYTENALSTLAFMLTQSNSLRRKELADNVIRKIHQKASDLDEINQKRLQRLVTVLYPIMLLSESGHYKDDLELLLRHLERARTDIMDRYFPFFASVQSELEKYDRGNVKLGAAVKAFAGRSADAITEELVKHSIQGSSASAQMLESHEGVADYFSAKLTHEGLKFSVQRKTHTAMHSRDTNVFDNGVTNIDITDKVMLIMQTLFKE